MSVGDNRHAVGVIGLGNMGGSMARALVTAGLDVMVFDLRDDLMAEFVSEGAAAASSVADLAGRCDIVSLVVVNDAQVDSVGDQVVAAAAPGTTLIVHSTVLPSTVVALSERAAVRGVGVFDAAVSGGPEKGVQGALTLMVGGDDALVDKCRPVLDAVGANVHHVGPVGSGSAVKLVNNMMTLGTYALAIEAMQLGAAYGLSEDAMTQVVTSAQGDSRVMRTWGRMDRIRRERVQATGGDATHAYMAKDLMEAAIAGGQRHLVMPMASAAAVALPSKMAERDRGYDPANPGPPIPRCVTCGQELAAPFRPAGMHPECRGGTAPD